jgi:hypothetical protein
MVGERIDYCCFFILLRIIGYKNIVMLILDLQERARIYERHRVYGSRSTDLRRISNCSENSISKRKLLIAVT